VRELGTVDLVDLVDAAELVDEVDAADASAAVRRPGRVARALVPWTGRFLHLFGLLVGLNLADLVTTRLVLDRGGTEANPVLEPIIHSMAHASLLKALCLAIVGLLLVRTGRTVRVAAVLLAVNAWYTFVVLWNLRVLLAI
jgi:hypothetical protein